MFVLIGLVWTFNSKFPTIIMVDQLHSSFLLLLTFFARGIFADFQVISDTECSGVSSYSQHVQIDGPSRCETNCNNDANCKAFVHCYAGPPTWCVDNCFYFSSSCPSTQHKGGATLYRKKIHGGWSNWGGWGGCSLECGRGTRSRSRSCNNPSPQYGGNNCGGSTDESGDCNTHACPVHGGWSDWSSWAGCSVTCGGGTRSRSRSCTNPSPQHGGNSWAGSTTENNNCNNNPCPIDGGWTTWSEWSACSVTCANGVQERSRSCTDPVPQYNGNACTGNETDDKVCVLPDCPVTMIQAKFITRSLSIDEGKTSQRLKCAATCSATQTCVSFSLDSEGNCVTKETNDDEGYNIV